VFQISSQHLPANNFATFLHVVNNGFADATDRSLLDPREDKATREVARGLALTPEIIERSALPAFATGSAVRWVRQYWSC
jgi:hypothetical protein